MFLAWCNCINNWFAASASLAYMLTTLLSPLCYQLNRKPNNSGRICRIFLQLHMTYESFYKPYEAAKNSYISCPCCSACDSIDNIEGTTVL